MPMEKAGKQSFVKGAAILGIAGLICKIIGAFFRIPLYNMLGDGMQYYEAVYPYYSTLLVISSAGLPTAISRMVAERVTLGDNHGAKRVFRKAQLLLLGIGIVTTALMFLGADYLAATTVGAKAAMSFRALAPALLIVSLMCAYRGYLQGMQRMTGTALSQVVEQVGKLAIGLFLAYKWMPRGLEYGAMGALVGVTLSELAALIVVAGIYFLRRNRFLPPDAVDQNVQQKNIIGGLLAIAIPVTIGASIMPITGIVDATMIKRTLMEIGFSEAAASMRYVALRSNVTNIINMPAVLTMALAMSLVPAISAARTAGDKKGVRRVSSMGIKLAMFIGLPCAVGLFVLAGPAIDLLYDIDAERLQIAAALMRTSAIGVVFLSLVQTLTGALQGAGKQNVPVINLIIGGVVKVILMLVLMRNPNIEIQGAAIGTVACYAVAGILDAIYLIRFVRLRINWLDTIIKPLVASLAMGVAAFFSYQFAAAHIHSNSIATCVAILVGIVIYMAILIGWKMFDREDAKFLPGRGYLARLLCRR